MMSHPLKVPTFYFIGVTTGQSSIMTLFPHWVKALGCPEVEIKGIDITIGADPDSYRQIVAHIKTDPLALGGLVTTHKIDLLNATRDMFDYLDSYAQICGEVSSISKQNGQLEGHAKDPISAGRTLAAMLGDTYFARTGGDILCFGAGGAATAISLYLIKQKEAGNRPQRLAVVDLSESRLTHLQQMTQALEPTIHFEYIANSIPAYNDELMARIAPGSLIINATGMGKDRPGSPITDEALFPPNSLAWELNYRGALDFKHQALAQQHIRNTRVEDGWLYFLHGWSQVMAQVLHQPIEGEQFDRLATIANSIR